MAAKAGWELGRAHCPVLEGRGVPVDPCLQRGRPSKERAAHVCPDVWWGLGSEPWKETAQASESAKGGHGMGQGREAKMGGLRSPKSGEVPLERPGGRQG